MWTRERVLEQCRRFLTGPAPDMALADCHTPGVDSIVVRLGGASGWKMLRVFIAWHERQQLWRVQQDSGQYTVAVHNHRFHLTLIPLLGEVVNYEVKLAGPAAPAVAELHQFWFDSGVNGEMGLIPNGKVNVTSTRERVLTGPFEMLATDFHTVKVPLPADSETLPATVWAVLEGPDIQDSCLLSPIPDPFITSQGLYTRLTIEQARDRLRFALRAVL